ncbi:MAG TPA: Gfo/Idh/MocA family oxidoreductase [Bryobacteraceae bacterium]|nr:Gfo/Idh/MocA family oxidoreductase [Bryobacteraceae bacterium]
MASRRGFLGGLAGSAAAATAGSAQGRPAGSRLGIGLIGCGTRGTHLAGVVRNLSQTLGEAADVVAVCDVYKPRRERAAQRFSAQPYGLAAELLRDPKVDAVIVATPDRVHVYNSLEAVRAGKDVYCEKPLTHWQQFDQLKQLVREVRERRTVFQIGAQWVTDPVYLRAADLVKQGTIGRPVHAQCGYFRQGDSGEAGMPIDDPNARPGPDLNWDAWQADAPQRPFTAQRLFQWRLFMDYSGGPATDLYPHAMTRVFKVMGVNLPKRVAAVGGKYVYDNGRDVPDTFDMLIEYPENVTIAVLGTIANEHGLDTVVRGTEGTLTFSQAGFTIQPQQRSTKRRAMGGADRTEPEHMRNFLDSIRARKTPNGDIELGYRVQVPLIMAMRSYVEGKVAYFDAATETIRMG